MTNWEEWLRAAAKRPSDYEDSKRSKTESEIKAALAAHEPLKGRPYRVYAKGSYANNTNVRLNYDVDIAVEYYGYFYYDLAFAAKELPKSDVGIVDSTDPYTREHFKTDIRAALESAFGKSSLSIGKIAYRVREKKTTLPADVVPCWEYRRYDSLTDCHIGSCVYPTGGGKKVNYPQQQYDNGVLKNNRTGRRYKRMVRACKKLQSRLLDGGAAFDEIASYHMECLVYNVPDDHFNKLAYKADMRGVLAYLFNQTLPSGNWEEFTEVNELKYLFKGGNGPSRDQTHVFAEAAWDEIGFE